MIVAGSLGEAVCGAMEAGKVSSQQCQRLLAAVSIPQEDVRHCSTAIVKAVKEIVKALTFLQTVFWIENNIIVPSLVLMQCYVTHADKRC